MFLTNDQFSEHRDTYTEFFGYPKIEFNGDTMESIAGTPAVFTQEGVEIQESGDFYDLVCREKAMVEIKKHYPSVEEAVAALLSSQNV